LAQGSQPVVDESPLPNKSKATYWRTRQVSITPIRIANILVPSSVRVPWQMLLNITQWRNARSASLLVTGTCTRTFG
jgi:hypothetical protein